MAENGYRILVDTHGLSGGFFWEESFVPVLVEEWDSMALMVSFEKFQTCQVINALIFGLAYE